MTINIYSRSPLIRAVRFDGTEEGAEEVISFMRKYRGDITDESGAVIQHCSAGFSTRGVSGRTGRTFLSGDSIPDAEFDLSRVVFVDDRHVTAVVWNDTYHCWLPLRTGDYVCVDEDGVFYPLTGEKISTFVHVGTE